MTRLALATATILATNHTTAAVLGAGIALMVTGLGRMVLAIAKCPDGCYCVKDRWVWRCTVCGHLC